MTAFKHCQRGANAFIDETMSADEIRDRFKLLSSEQTRFKLRNIRINLRLARIYTLLFFVRSIRISAEVVFNIFDYFVEIYSIITILFKEFVGHDNSQLPKE